MLADGKGMLFNTENTTEEKMILRKDRVDDFYKKNLNMNKEDIVLSSEELVNRDNDNKVTSFKAGQMDNDTTRVRELEQKLKSLSEQLCKVLDNNQEKLKTIAEAVQDHNIDFCMKNEQKTRYEARSIYGMIIADADKDNIPEVFALRTLAFSYNKWAKEMNPGYFADKQGEPIVKICATHILHQSWERFKQEGFTKVFNDCFQYKKIEKMGVQDNSFHAVIDDVLDDESISEKRACDTFVREIQEKVKQHSAKDEEKIELDNQSIEHGIGEMDNFKTENSDANCETNDEHNDDFSGDTI